MLITPIARLQKNSELFFNTHAIDVDIYLELELLVKHRLKCFSEDFSFVRRGLARKKICFHVGV